MEPPSKKMRTLWDDDNSSDSGDDAGGVSLTKAPEAGFKINEDFARRFEHNKKREEVQKLESKYGKSSSLGKHRADEPSDEESSDDEEEDDDGELATEVVDAEIMATLKAIREKDPRVYDANATFYTKLDEDDEAPKEKKEKPMTLHDYHRQNLLKGVDVAEEEEKATIKTFAQEQAELKDALVKQLHAADSDDEMEDAEDNFLVRKAGGADVVPEKEIELDIENADKDPETFLSNFLSARAWIPAGSQRELHPFDSDDDEELDQADAFEEAYNFRFEDPSKLNEKIMTHARDTTNSLSVRREDKSARKKLRDAERQRKEEEKKERDTEKNRLRKLKTEELQKKVSQIKEVAGLRAAEFTDEDWARFLDDAWDDKEWEKEMQKRFGEGYYEEPETEGKKHPKKPTWDDDIDIKDLIPDYADEEEIKPSLESGDEGEDVDEEEEEGASGSKKSKAELRREQKRDARKERLRIEEAVDRNLDLDITLLPGATKKNATRFRYRETSPQSFGLTARDILMADDTQLNQFAGLKKLASFRDAEKKAKDERKLGKKARLRQWRKDTFGNEEGPVFEFGSGKRKVDADNEQDGDETKLDIREGDGSGRKKRKRSKKH
ncbi:ribosome biogenesis protein Kri1 [Penicillium brasilianum]|uniref:Ribosome biogenesis protein Kri1 n=1 Tax=Penicillium brasilianum TaxID=104259 RepID=A0A1S9S1F0_PENBI|nr:ribosome biogenesis protein Kri1 [Penicillium brasilianum]